MIPVRISKYKNIFANFCSVPNWSEEVFVIKKIKKTVPWIYVIIDLQKTNKKEFRIEKVITTKGDKQYVKGKGWNSSFNSWIDKIDIV